MTILAVGIDLGTTYSSVALVDEHGTPEIVPNSQSERLTPSAVLLESDSMVVGQIAKDAAATDPDNAIVFVKRQIGNTSWYVNHVGKRYDAVEISAVILKKLKQDAEAYLNQSITHAVITVPAYFDEAKRRDTIAAGEMAGLQILDLINEPTAAAIAFGVERSTQNERILVYDLGGGTFDVTVMEVKGKEVNIIATDGDHQLGGKDFEDAIINLSVEAFKTEHGFDPTEDPFVSTELRERAEKAKKELSERAKTLIMIRSQGKVTRFQLTREEFTTAIKPRLSTTLSLIRSVLRESKLKPEAIDRVLLIGGSTRILAVREILKEFFGKEPDSSVNPDEAVALGAALVAAKRVVDINPEDVPAPVVEKVGGLAINDVTSHSLGIEAFIPGTTDKINSILIRRNSPIPTEVSKEFVTSLPGQTAIRVTIYQGEFEDPNLCNPIGDFTLSGLPPDRPAGQKVRVTIACGNDGVVSVSAVDIASGQETTTEVSYNTGYDKKKTSAKAKWLNSASVT